MRERLSMPRGDMKARYDVVIVGSGYGGSIAASLLSRARRQDGSALRVCLLERGREIPVGAFPKSLLDAASELQVNARGQQHGKQDGLYWLHASDNIAIFHGCGLGGTSLINAGVSMRPSADVWNDARWPTALVSDRHGGLERGFVRASAMLGVRTYPKSLPLAKDLAFRQTARAMGAEGDVIAAPLNISFDRLQQSTDEAAGNVSQATCNGCGNCVAGCNVGAKNTLAMNYLPDAVAHGAEIYCRIQVQRVTATRDGYRVYYQGIGDARDIFAGDEMFVDAGLVIMAAGVLGSCEILLRSKAAGLSCSDRVGKDLSGNGDGLGFLSGPAQVNGIGLPTHTAQRHADAPGPCITALIDRRSDRPRQSAHVIQNGVIPAPLAHLLPSVMRLCRTLDGAAASDRWWAKVKDLVAQRGVSSLDHTQTLLVMSHDDSPGEVTLDADHADVSWRRATSGVRAVHEALRQAAHDQRASYVAVPPAPSPRDASAAQDARDYHVTVHPLGGCAMADDATRGVTNHRGQVFADTTGDHVHENLYVADASLMPCSLGVNPALTIAAIAERNVQLLIADRGWSVDLATGGRPRLPNKRPHHDLQVQFTERIAGHCSTRALTDGDYAHSERTGRRERGRCELIVTVGTEDLRGMLRDPQHTAHITGSVTFAALSRAPMTIEDGTFKLFADTTDALAHKHMSYRMKLQSEEGERYFLEGFKRLGASSNTPSRAGRPATAIWRDTTTLYVTLHRGDDTTAPKVAQGILHITAPAFLKELLHMKATAARGGIAVNALAMYGQLFASGLWRMYDVMPSLASLPSLSSRATERR